MKIEQIYTGCLAEAAYYIESNGEAAIIDPLRESSPYLERAQKDNAKIKYIFETHFHADFVSGHIDLAAKTGAQIVYGPTSMPTGFEKIVAEDGQEFSIGDVILRVIHTPGHTMESSCYLLLDASGKEHALFSGDTLFIGDVGRPDLAQKVIPDLTQDKLARHLYHSLRDKILPLPDHVVVYPNHGRGSACGKNMSSETFDTLGNQKKTNYALQEMSEDDFVEKVLDGLTPPPSYFPQNVLLNIQGYESLDTVMDQGKKALNGKAFLAAAEETEALVLDTRSADAFRMAHLPGSIFIGIDGSFATWVGTLVPDVKQAILLVADKDRLEEVIMRLARVGYDNVIGYLEEELENMETDSVPSMEVSDLAKKWPLELVDVRKASEYQSEHVEGALNAPLDYINESQKLLVNSKKYHVHCEGGYRSMVFISILRARGYTNLVDIKGGFKAIKAQGSLPVTDYVCPTTLL